MNQPFVDIGMQGSGVWAESSSRSRSGQMHIYIIELKKFMNACLSSDRHSRQMAENDSQRHKDAEHLMHVNR